MKNENIDYKEILRELISNLKAKPEYLKLIPKDEKFNQDHFDGMALSYHFMMDEIIETLKVNEVELEIFDLDNYDIVEILNYKPLTKKIK